MGYEITGLHIVIDSTGAVKGGKAAVRALDEVGEAAGKTEKKVRDTGKSFEDLKKNSMSSLGQLKPALMDIAKYTGIAFSTKAIAQFAMESFHLAARYESLGVVVHQVGRVAGYSAFEIDKNVSALRNMGIAGIEARQTMTRLIQAQVDITKSSQLARAAQDAAVIGGVNSSEAFERMVHGIQSANSQILRGIGINTNFEQAYSKLAVQLGKTTSDLSEQEKVQARLNEVLESAKGIVGTYEASMETLGKQVGSLSRLHQDLMTDVGMFAVEIAAASKVIPVYSNFIIKLNTEILELRGTMKGISQEEMARALEEKGIQGLRALTEESDSARKELERLRVQLTVLEKQGFDVSGIVADLDEIEKKSFSTSKGVKALALLIKGIDRASAFAFIPEREREWLITGKLKEWRDAMERKQKESVAVGVGSLGVKDEQIRNINPERPDKLFNYRGKDYGAEETKNEFRNAWEKTPEGVKSLKEKQAEERVERMKAFLNTTLTEEDRSEALIWQSAFQKELLDIQKSSSSPDKALKGREEYIKRAQKAGQDEFLKTVMEAQEAIPLAHVAVMESAAKAREETDKLKIESEAAARAAQDFDIQMGLRKVGQQEANREITAVEAMKAKLVLLEQELQMREDIYESIKGTDNESINARNTSLQQLESTREKLLEIQRLLADRTAIGGAKAAWMEYTDAVTNLGRQIHDVTTNAFKGMEDALYNFVHTGKISFREFADSVIADIRRILVKQAMLAAVKVAGNVVSGGIGSIFGNLFGNAKGNIFDMGNVIPFRRGGIVDKPTIFPFAQGIGLMGEAGAEAIMPLSRTSDGDLGVKAIGGGMGITPQVNINIHTPPGVRTETQQSQGSGGDMNIEIFMEMIDNATASGITSGRSKTAHALRNMQPI